jgi:predicted CoA-binding protein
MATMESIRDFLGQKRIAMIGVSQQPKEFSRVLFRELCERGYDVVPVNPGAREIEGRPCFARVQDIGAPVDGALIMTSPDVRDGVVRDCVAIGIKRVWMYRASGRGAVSPGAVRFCEANGVAVIAGECPLMFLPNGAWIHGMHALIRRVLWTYPT